jgi:multicomponent Na+:H+ antiporter subunit E
MGTLATMMVAAIFLLLWLLLTNGDPASLLIGLPVVAGALLLARRLAQATPRTLSVSGTLGFIPYFLRESLRGGWNVARATLSPRMRLSPAFIDYRISLASDGARVFFTNCVSLLPGTLAARLDGSRLRVHVLDDSSDPLRDLEELETRIGAIFSERPGKPETGHD